MQDAAVAYNPHDYSRFQLWCLGLGAINAQYHGERHDLLRHADANTCDQVLQTRWNIHGCRGYLDSVQWLRREGHRTGFAEHWGAALVTSQQEWEAGVEALKASDPVALQRQLLVRHYRGLLGSQGIIGWDLGRVIVLARMAATCLYISEQEAWDTIMEEGEQAARVFGNWYQFAHSYLIGRQYSARNPDDEAGQRNLQATHHLLADPASPWLRYPQFAETQLSESQFVESQFSKSQFAGLQFVASAQVH